MTVSFWVLDIKMVRSCEKELVKDTLPEPNNHSHSERWKPDSST
ncbi:hypothetical protein HMPREF3036_01785 [Sutterella sp. KLE1602]|nr:hypothetical protein HMPREF3036_01785 [Sutterella sp. KLE1602]